MMGVATLALLFNIVLLAAGVWGVSTGVSLLALTPFLLLVSVVEVAVWMRTAGGRRVAERSAEMRELAVRRIDIRRRNGIIDETTGLYTRWYLDRRIEEEADRCKRYKHSMAVVVLRVGIVDLTTFSLDAWQKRSSEAARAAARVVRSVDLSAALSPFEFAICLVHCDSDGACRALERMMEQMPGYSFEAGVAVFPDDGTEPSALIESASARLQPFKPRTSA